MKKKLVEKIKNSNDYKKFLDGKTLIKSIFVKDRLINLILK